jgi:8-oxo-dGTP pyrophosphatase MutT (NUDIX family)
MATLTLPKPRLNHRVRALLLTDAGRLLLFRRLKDGLEPYWVMPGGGVEPTDTSLEAALRREIREELGGGVQIIRSLYDTEHDGEGRYEGWRVRHHYYACYLTGYDLAQRTGSEFSNPAKGQYIPDEFPLDAEVINRLSIKTAEAKAGLLANLHILKRLA